MPFRLPAVVICLAATTAARGAEVAPTVSSFDGRWSVSLVCPDTQDRKGPVKGYAWTFPVTIAAGKVSGRYGTTGAPSSVRYAGEVVADGTLELEATGNTGNAEYSVGEVARGTNYGYTLTGHLDQGRGQAVRREVRPCTATFVRLPD